MKLFLPLFCLLAPALAHAALEFRVLSWKGDLDDLHYASSSGDVAISARERVLSPVYRLDGSGPLTLHRVETRAAQPPRRVPVATLVPPANLTRALLVLNRDDDGGVQGRWLDDSVRDNPAGSLRLHNLSSQPLAVKIGNETRLLDRAAHTRVDFPTASRALPLQVAAEIDGVWKQVASTSQPVRRHYRLIILLRDGRPTIENPVGPVECLAFYDVPPKEDAVLASLR